MRRPRLLSRADGATQSRVELGFDAGDRALDYYEGVVLGAGVLGARAMTPSVREDAMTVLARLEPDDYSEYLQAFIARGAELAGEEWRYADIVTVLRACAALLEPTSYLEIGVRRGRSMAMVAEARPDCAIVGVDMWLDDYAGMENPGPDHIRTEMQRLGHRGDLQLLSGDSHEVVPELFDSRPELSFDLITVDGDHTPRGAREDLTEVLPRLRIGGALVFDDIRHPSHPELFDVWNATVSADRRYACWEFGEVGYGVALAVRRW